MSVVTTVFMFSASGSSVKWTWFIIGAFRSSRVTFLYSSSFRVALVSA